MRVAQATSHRTLSRRRAGQSAQRLFFPAAAVLAALGPWLLLGLPGHWQPAVDVGTHARGMLLGYVGALIAGYLGGRLPTGQLAVLFCLWLAGRGVEILATAPLITHAVYAGFGLCLAVLVVPRFRGAKKWRNRLTGPLLVAITCFPFVLWAGSTLELPPRLALHALLLLVAMLMFFMGGRFITPVLARAYADRGARLPHRVQPALEGTVMLLLPGAVALVLGRAHSVLAALPVAVAGFLVLVRLARWRLFAPGPGHAELVALGIGYLWLGLGLLAFSLAQVGYLPTTASVHVITIGALGTLSSTIMLKLAHAPGNAPAAVHYLVVGLLAMATAARFSAAVTPAFYFPLLVVAGVLWSLGFLLVTYCLASPGRRT